MADYKVTDTELISVANAIRTKGGTSSLLEWPSGYISAINAIPTPGPEIVPFSTGTDEQIVAIIRAAHDGIIDLQEDAGWSVGDTRTIPISTYKDKYNSDVAAHNNSIAISSFDNYMNCGCVMQFDFVNCEVFFNMNDSRTNSGGYGATRMYTTWIPRLEAALPSWLRELLIEFSVLASAGSASSSIVTVSGNKLALRSEVEVNNTTSRSFPGEGVYLPYYANNKRKKQYNGSSYVTWGLRSPEKYGSEAFTIVDNSGGIGGYYANSDSAIAPFGCL